MAKRIGNYLLEYETGNAIIIGTRFTSAIIAEETNFGQIPDSDIGALIRRIHPLPEEELYQYSIVNQESMKEVLDYVRKNKEAVKKVIDAPRRLDIVDVLRSVE